MTQNEVEIETLIAQLNETHDAALHELATALHAPAVNGETRARLITALLIYQTATANVATRILRCALGMRPEDLGLLP